MKHSKDKPNPSQFRDIIRLPDVPELSDDSPPETKAMELVRQSMIKGGLEVGYTLEEAEAAFKNFKEIMDDPAKRATLDKLLEMSAEFGPYALQEAMHIHAAYLEQRDKPKPDLKLFTEAEADRRSKPKDGKGTPDLP